MKKWIYPRPRAQASQPSARLDSDDERDALDVQCSIAPDLSDDREENENAPTQDAEQATGSENENEIDKQEVQIKSVVASVPSSTSSVRLKPSTNEKLVADTSIVSGASQHEESLLLSQSVILHEKKHIQILSLIPTSRWLALSLNLKHSVTFTLAFTVSIASAANSVRYPSTARPRR